MPLASLAKKIVANISTVRLMTLSRFSRRPLELSPSLQDLVAKSVHQTDHVPLARWYNEIDREQLRKDKNIDLITTKRRFTTLPRVLEAILSLPSSSRLGLHGLD
jgi:hypothetical protein